MVFGRTEVPIIGEISLLCSVKTRGRHKKKQIVLCFYSVGVKEFVQWMDGQWPRKDRGSLVCSKSGTVAKSFSDVDY